MTETKPTEATLVEASPPVVNLAEINMEEIKLPETKPTANIDYGNSTYEIVSKVAYLIGVSKSIFQNEHEPPKMDIFEQLEMNKPARIIRNLCRLRTSIEQHYGKIYKAVANDFKSIYTLSEYVPVECFQALSMDGVSLTKKRAYPTDLIILINQHLSNRINNCKDIFPIWIKWEYIKDMIIVPNGLVREGVEAAANEYFSDKSRYPYQAFIHWPGANSGNILYTDKKFVTLLYERHEDFFDDLSKVTDASRAVKANIYQYLEDNDRTVLIVDCENSDPYKLYATLNNLDHEQLLQCIVKIILIDDVHTSSAWSILEKFTGIPIEHVVIERIKDNKSLVDMTLALRAATEFYENNVKAFILFASDSDYWALISSMPQLHFLVMVEYHKCGADIKNALINAGISFCYIDDFCTGNSNEIKVATVLSEVRSRLNEAFHMNVWDLLNESCVAARADMTKAESDRFYEKYIKKMRIVISEEGEATIEVA